MWSARCFWVAVRIFRSVSGFEKKKRLLFRHRARTFGAKKRWQGRRDSNPQLAVLETATLAVGVTALQAPAEEPRVEDSLLAFAMKCHFFVPGTILFHFKTTSCVLLVFLRAIVAPFAFGASKYDIDSHNCYSIISVTTPEPTVCPPSRIAKRSCSCMAMGAISSTMNCELSPGITISTPSGSVMTPVMSVVLK